MILEKMIFIAIIDFKITIFIHIDTNHSIQHDGDMNWPRMTAIDIN